MRTIINSTEAAMVSSTADSSSSCLAARGVARPNCCPAHCWNLLNKYLAVTSAHYWQDYECFALSLNVHCDFGECAMRRATIYSSDYVIFIHFKVSLLNFWVFSFQNVKSSVMRAHSWNWSISCYAQDCAFIFCGVFTTLFSSSFGAIGIDWATGRKLQQLELEIERHSQHASRCGKRKTQRPETVATIIGLQMCLLYGRVWFAGRHGPTSQM